MRDTSDSLYSPPKSMVAASVFIVPFLSIQAIIIYSYAEVGLQNDPTFILVLCFSISIIVLIFQALLFNAFEVGNNAALRRLYPDNWLFLDQGITEVKYLRDYKEVFDDISFKFFKFFYIIFLTIIAAPSLFLFLNILVPVVRGEGFPVFSNLQWLSGWLTIIIFGMAIFWLREIKAWWFYGYIEAFIATGISAVCFKPGVENPVIRLLALVSGLRVFVDGLKRVRDFNPSRSKKYSSVSDYFFSDERLSSKEFGKIFAEMAIEHSKTTYYRNRRTVGLPIVNLIFAIIDKIIFFSAKTAGGKLKILLLKVFFQRKGSQNRRPSLPERSVEPSEVFTKSKIRPKFKNND